MRWWMAVGGVNVLLGLVVGAYAAHGLPATVEAAAQTSLQTALTIQMLHGVGLCLIGLSLPRLPAAKQLQAAGLFLVVGIILFCGGIYAKVLLDAVVIGRFVPWGGAAMMAGWVMFILVWLLRGAYAGPR